MSRSRFAPAWMPLLAALLLAGCGDDDSTKGTEAVAAADVERYCELSEELDAAGGDKFAALEEDPDATPEDFEQAEAELVEENEAQLEEAQEVAPPEIQADVETLVAGLRVRAGLEQEGPSSGDVAAAEKRIKAFEKASCG